MEKDDWEKYFISFIPSFIIVILTIFLIIIYSKTKELHSYPCYFNIILSSVISIDNVLRLIPVYEDKNSKEEGKKPNDKFICKFQGFSLALFDKLMLTTMTIYSIISFLGLVKYQFYKSHERCLFITLIVIGFLISLFLAILFILNGVTNYDDVCYVKADKEDDNDEDLKVNKQLIDILVTSILLLINIYCIGHILFFLYGEIKENKNDDNKKKNYYYHFWKYLIDLILTFLTFLMVILIIADKFIDSSPLIESFIYVMFSLLIVLFFTINSRILKEIKRLLCCKAEEKSSSNIEVEDDEDEGIEISNINNEHLIN